MSDTARLSAALEGRYRIERELGEGGMATVWLAEDVKHQRKVALKVLRPELAAVLGGDRFLAEIRTTANLQHPHILPLFDSGEADGFLYYVMPYIDGETLRDRLDREKQLGVDEAIRITKSVADALDYAHRQGVIHRDIKPANILLHDGRPVVADFGIAVAVSAAGGGRMTETGLSLGTPHYMSPEQASADRDLSARSDVYSLGCVLYEMIAGQPPHTGPSAQSVLIRILTESPRALTELRHTVPPHVSAVVAKAIEKLPADRFESAQALIDALDDETFTYAPAQRTAPRAVPTGAHAAAPAGKRTGVPIVPLLGGLLVVSLALAAWGWLRPGPVAPVQRYRLDVDAADYTGRDIAISPDGSRVVYVGPDQQLYQRMLSSLEAVPVAGARPARFPFFSPDGNSVGFTLGPGNADRASTVVLSSGSPITLGNSDAQVDPGGAWLDDGFVYYLENRSPNSRLMRVPAQGGTPEVVETDVAVSLPAAIPGVTDRLLVWVLPPERGIGILDLGTGKVAKVTGLENGIDPQYAGGFIFWVTNERALVAAQFDPAAGRLTSVPVTLTEGVEPTGYTVSRTGTLIYIGNAAAATTGEMPGWLERNGDKRILDERLGSIATDFDDLRLSGNGYLALEIQRNPDGSPDEEHRILIYDMDEGTNYQLTFEGRLNQTPRWMPDGRVAYRSDQGGRDGIWAQPFDRSGSESALFETDHEIEGFDASPRRGAPLVVALYPANDTSGFRQGLYLVDEGSNEPRPFVTTRFYEGEPAISPDGRWLAYTSDESGRTEVYVRAFPEGGRPWPISTEESRAPAWGPAGDEILYVTPDGVVAARLEIDGGIRVTSRSPLFDGDYELTRPSGAGYDVAPDGRLIATFERSAQVEGTASDQLPIVVLNVFEELRQRLRGSGRR